MYAKLGTVIGHEISHAFDPKGAQFDKDGNFANWWTEEDNKVFAGAESTTLMADPEDVAGFFAFLARYKKALPVERSAAELL